MKRNLIILILIAVMSLVAGSIIYYAAGLGNGEDIKLSGKINVVADSGNYGAVNHAAAVFKELHPRIEIDVTEESDVYADVSSDLKTGGLKEDVFVVPEKNVLPLLKSSEGYFMDLTQYVNGVGESFPEGVLSGLTYNKSIYGIPWTTKPMVVLYRKDLFSVNGVDVSEIKTWDDFRKTGTGLSGKTGKKFLIYNSHQFEQLRSTLLSQLRIKYSDQENYTRATELINGMVADKTLQATSSAVSTLKQGKAMAAIVSPSDTIKIMNEASPLQGKWGAMELPAFEPGGNRDV
ncbi:MAG TPA: extracellular solute-binding protein, partial [Clostridiaceae bacterium]